jgi:3-hydroxyacyl-CoA dehydrogenase/enoyl-CoA hydratase/3-hydroxybutyryl-CoA epimerase
MSLNYRRLETSGKPWVAAINGTCAGGAFELALACHRRIASENEKTRVGLPEIKVGLFPGAGGTQRVPRMIPAGDALQFLFRGELLRLDRAKAMKLIDEVVPADKLIETAKAWIRNGGKGVQPWDVEGFKLPGGTVYSKAGMMTWPPANAIYRRETYDNYPAAKAILQCVFEGLQLPMTGADGRIPLFREDPALQGSAGDDPHAVVSMQELNKGARRPASVPAKKLKKVAILGAGFMGAGIASVTAQAGIEVVLIDRDQASADKGKAHVEKTLGEQVTKGRIKPADRDALLARIVATPDYAAIAGADLVIEAVFEDRKVKEEAIKKAEAVLGDKVIFGSNTSTCRSPRLPTCRKTRSVSSAFISSRRSRR